MFVQGSESNSPGSYEPFINSYTTAQIAALTGMALRQIVFDTTRKDYRFYDGTRWVSMAHPNYEVYTALLTQEGTDAPVATVIDNTLGGTVVWTRSSMGSYLGTLAGAFTTNKTVIFLTPGTTSGFLLQQVVSVNQVNIITPDVVGSPADDILLASPIEIRVYY